jgi:hypothetical protein
MTRLLGISLLLFTLYTHAALAVPYRQFDNPRPKPWPQLIWREFKNIYDDVVYSLNNVIFDLIEDIRVSAVSTDYYRLRVGLKREVFNNQDILNTFTVIDYFKLESQSRNLNIEVPMSSPNLTLNFFLGINAAQEWINIRKVTASRYSTLPNINTSLDTIIENSRSNDEIDEVETDTGYSQFGPSWRPRTNRLWNFFTIPWKLPLNMKKYNKLEDGELVSFGVSGFVELGADVGFNLVPSTEMNVGVGVRARTFLEGKFRITVLKENDRYARVKLTRENSKGFGVTVGGRGRDIEVFKGFMLLEGTSFEDDDFLRQKINVLPFEFKTEKRYSKLFDIGYRYDLRDPLAKEAYLKAVRGNFKYTSLELNKRNPTVEKIFTRQSSTNQSYNELQLNVELFKSKKRRLNSRYKARIELPDGSHVVTKDYQELTQEWKTLWGRFEKLNYKFTLAMDQTAFTEGKKDSYGMVVEAFIEDSHTNGKEMNRYINVVEMTLGDDELLPELPAYAPRLYNSSVSSDDFSYSNRYKKAKYRYSSFYYGFYLTDRQLEKIAAIPKDELWKTLEIVFYKKEGQWSTPWKRTLYAAKNMWATVLNGPLFLANLNIKSGNDLFMAKKLYKRIMAIKKHYTNIYDSRKKMAKERVDVFNALFQTRNYNHELMRLLMFSLKDEEIEYFLTATNDSFGRIQRRGKILTDAEYLLQLTDENIGFERLAGSVRIDPKLSFSKLKIPYNEEQSAFEFEFESNHRPKLFFIKLQETSPLQKVRTLKELLVKNDQRFVKGRNSILLDPMSPDEISYLLSRELEEGKFYTFTIASSLDGLIWGKTSSFRFLNQKPLPQE